MASGFILPGSTQTELRGLRCRSSRCNSYLLKPTVVTAYHKPCNTAVPEAVRRLAQHAQRGALIPASNTAFRSNLLPSVHYWRSYVKTAAAASAAAVGDASDAGSGAAVPVLLAEVQRLGETVSKQTTRFWALSGKFMPMVGLFFMLAFVNTILDSLKDTLVITSIGGGAQVIPYLTVYAVLPSSLIFLVLYSYASQRFKRQALFNGIVAVFMAFFVAFAFVLYPNHQLLHLTGWAEGVAASLPLGLDGAVGMIRNWTFTLFFCMSELWGDVCLGLLFWGLANDTTNLADAPTLYPLFGLGANVAQALAGFVLKFFSGPSSHGTVSFTHEFQSLMIVVLAFSTLALALHHVISITDNRQRLKRRQRQATELRAGRRAAVAAAAAAEVAAAAADATPRSAENQMQPESAASTSSSAPHPVAPSVEKASGFNDGKRRQSKQNLSEIYRTLSSSVPIRCLVVMSMAQGLCTNLMEFAWKSHIRMLYPTPAAFTSFLGDVSTWQGIVTGLLMVLSPTMFERMGWAGVAAATPKILLYGGGLFFASAMVYQLVLAPTTSAAASAAGVGVLQLLVYGGALLYIFSKSAKFSLFKPAEEMVYISLDEEGRTKGKAAIDVVGSQAGKSGGSVLQQVLLLLCGGAIAMQLPMMVVVYLAMSQSWLKAVSTLSRVNKYGHASSVHESMHDSMEVEAHEGTSSHGQDENRGGGSRPESAPVLNGNVVGAFGSGFESSGNGAGDASLSPDTLNVIADVGHENGFSNGNGHHGNGATNGYSGNGAMMYSMGTLNGHSISSSISSRSTGKSSGAGGGVYGGMPLDAPQPAAA